MTPHHDPAERRSQGCMMLLLALIISACVTIAALYQITKYIFNLLQ